MDIGMYQGAGALNAYEEWQNNVAHNLANVSTAGFKGKGIAMEKSSQGKIPTETFSEFERLLIGSSPEASQKTDFQQGSMVDTGKPTDMAIDGEGFFQVRLPDGQTMLTRDGQFHINNNYTLVNARGFPVLSQGGTPIVFDPNETDPVVNRQGEVFQGETALAPIAVSVVEDKETLRNIDGGFLLNEGGVSRPALAGEYNVYQGVKEGSNTSAMVEMVNMINLSRSYESNTRVIQAYDSRYGQAIQQLGTT